MSSRGRLTFCTRTTTRRAITSIVADKRNDDAWRANIPRSPPLGGSKSIKGLLRGGRIAYKFHKLFRQTETYEDAYGLQRPAISQMHDSSVSVPAHDRRPTRGRRFGDTESEIAGGSPWSATPHRSSCTNASEPAPPGDGCAHWRGAGRLDRRLSAQTSVTVVKTDTSITLSWSAEGKLALYWWQPGPRELEKIEFNGEKSWTATGLQPESVHEFSFNGAFYDSFTVTTNAAGNPQPTPVVSIASGANITEGGERPSL